MKNKLRYLLFLPLLLTSCALTPSESSESNIDTSTDVTETSETSETSGETEKPTETETETETSETEQPTETETETETETTSTDTEEKLDAWTIMIYMCGSDLESGTDNYGKLSALATADIKEILSVSNQPDDVNIIIETGGASKWASTYNISSTKLGRYHVENKKLVKDAELTYASMGATSTFESFLNWGLQDYPAEKTGVIFWNHGGALDGCCFDEKKNDDSLTDAECKTAFTNAFKANNISKLEFVGYDCCLMQVQDIADFNSEFFNYMVASQESEAGEGWAYHEWIDDLYNHKDTETILKEICDGFVEDYEKTYGAYYDNDQTLSVLDLSKMKAYRTAFESLFSKMKSTISSKKTNVYNTILKCKTFGNDVGYTADEYNQCVNNYNYDSSWFIKESDGTYTLLGSFSFGTIDVKDFLTRLKSLTGFTTYSSDIDNVISLLKDLVIYNVIGDEAGNSNGLTCVAYLYTGFYQDYYKTSYTNFTNYRSAMSVVGK